MNNGQFGRNDPPYEVRISKDDTNPRRYHSFSLKGNNIRFIYDVQNPLCSGAVCWCEVDE
jgi:hypothetical protein